MTVSVLAVTEGVLVIDCRTQVLHMRLGFALGFETVIPPSDPTALYMRVPALCR